eukprot:146364-Rhodomonas_salina.1
MSQLGIGALAGPSVFEAPALKAEKLAWASGVEDEGAGALPALPHVCSHRPRTEAGWRGPDMAGGRPLRSAKRQPTPPLFTSLNGRTQEIKELACCETVAVEGSGSTAGITRCGS